MSDKEIPEEFMRDSHDQIFQPGVLAQPWWLEIKPAFSRESNGNVPAHWSYLVTSGNPDTGGTMTKNIGHSEILNMIRTIATGTYRQLLGIQGTAPSIECRKACNRFLARPSLAGFTAEQAGEVLQMVMWDQVAFDGPM